MSLTRLAAELSQVLVALLLRASCFGEHALLAPEKLLVLGQSPLGISQPRCIALVVHAQPAAGGVQILLVPPLLIAIVRCTVVVPSLFVCLRRAFEPLNLLLLSAHLFLQSLHFSPLLLRCFA